MSAPPRWPVTLGDKLADWESLTKVGGTQWIVGKSVLDIGPGRGLDALLFAPEAQDYCVLDPDRDVLNWIEHIDPEHKIERWAGVAEAMPFLDDTFDTVLDFSSIDNCQEPFKCYREAFRVLKPHGLLLSSYANRSVLGALPDQHTQDPDALQIWLTQLGFWPRWHGRCDQARACIAVQKYGEQLKGKHCMHCNIVHDEGE